MIDKKYPVLLLTVLCSVLQAPARGETARPGIAKCTEALGGERAWRAIETLELSGRHTSFSHTEPFLLRRKRPDLYRFDHNEGSFALTVAYDGETAWWRTEVPLISKAHWPTETPVPHTRAIELEAEFAPPFVGWEDKGHGVTWVGETELEGEPFLELRIRRSQDTDAVERWFFDPSSFLPVLRLSRGTYHGYDTEQIVHFADYREISGVLLPHRVETELGNDYLVLEVASARVNVPIADEVFSRPLPAGMETLRSLAGRWRVRIESLDDPALHTERLKTWQEDETVSVIRSRFGGGLLEEEIAITTARPRRVKRLYSYDRFREVFRIAYFDTFSDHLVVFKGRLEGGRLVVSNLETETPLEILQQTFHMREILYDLTADAFRLDREVSVDGGRTWLPDIRFVYSRMPDEGPEASSE